MASYLGLFGQPCYREGGALQTNVTGLCGEHLQWSGHTGFAPAQRCVLSSSTLLRLPDVLYGVGLPLPCGSSFQVFHKSADSVGPVFHAFPSPSSSGSQELDKRTLPGCGAPSHLCGPSLSFHGYQLGVCALCLFSGAGL